MLRDKKKYTFCIIVLLFFTACGLNSEQEMALNKDLLEYVYARNNGDAIKQIGYTHPSIVKKYVEGDSLELLERFQELQPKVNGVPWDLSDSTFIWDNYYVMNVKSSGKNVQVHITIKASNDLGEEKSIPLVAVSLNNGKNWVFLKEDELAEIH